MKTALLSIFLLIMVVAVSYIKAVRQEEKVDRSFQLAQRTGQQEVHLSDKNQSDSIYKKEIRIIDAPTNKTPNLDDDNITSLKSKPLTQYSVKKEVYNREILDFYNKQYRSLLNELTADELKTAVLKLRQETAQKYSISVSELNRLREKYKINF